ncbi:Segment polarity protein dishevelled DVL-3 [Echinococcus granulosus]|uniref:Segment polarity protein dishevelled DVL-3 n=1 Tax=Echinococcus granulosus TaxID=6210 RepID=W6UHQ9_ECHGR|nr:Segment polarity protein dishevelled DVL-3 [Echinococcus granulosus]EUB61035.1 Segment polarity protein dishevelled DVL-3 [Echinococcus granulosus]
MEDTKIIYHIDDENTPYLVKLSVNADKVTLGDFKAALNRPNYKFFFKSVDADFGVVKEEISDDLACLPCFNGRVIAWLVTADGSAKSDNHSSTGDGLATGDFHDEPSKNATSNKANANDNRDECETCGDSESVCSGDHLPPLRNFQSYKHGKFSCSRLGKLGRGNQSIYDTSSSMLSSDLESTSFFDSEDESSRFSTATGTTMSSIRYGAYRQRRRRRFMPISRISEDASSYSSMTDSTMSLNIVTVTLKMEAVNYLGISIVGQSNRAGDGGIYVGSIMRGGAVALDGRIEPGDMLLEVNGISFEDMSNDDAVRVLREQVQKPGPITLVVAKCWDPNPRSGCFVLSRQEPVRPIDPRAWVLHTNAMTAAAAGSPNANLHSDPLGGLSDANSTAFCGNYPILAGGVNSGGVMLSMPKSNASSSSVTPKSAPDSAGGGTGGAGGGGVGSTGPFLTHHSQAGSTQPPSELVPSSTGLEKSQQLNVATDMALVVRAMLQPDSGLEIHDRTWLKITIANAVIGSDLVDWLFAHVDGFNDRREVKKYASNLLKCGYIQHTVNKATFSEQCYYVFSDLAGTGKFLLNMEEMDSVSEIGGVTRHGPSGGIGMIPVNNGAGGSSVTSFARSLPPAGFSAASAVANTAAAASFWPSAVGAAGGGGMPQPAVLFPGPGNPSQPQPPPPPTHQHLTGLLPVSTAELQTVEMKGHSMLPTQQQQPHQQQQQQRADVVDDDGSSSAGSSSSTSTSSSSSSCSSTARQPPPPPPPQAHPVDTLAPSMRVVEYFLEGDRIPFSPHRYPREQAREGQLLLLLNLRLPYNRKHPRSPPVPLRVYLTTASGVSNLSPTVRPSLSITRLFYTRTM